MKSYQYPVYIKKSQAEELEEAIFPIFPSSKRPLHIDLNDYLVKIIMRDAGLDEYLKQLLLSELNELDEQNKKIEQPNPLEYYKPSEYKLFLMSGREVLRLDDLPQYAIALIGYEAERKAQIKKKIIM